MRRFVLVFVLVVPAAIAGAGQWTRVGPPLGNVYALAIDPGQPSTLFAGTSAGILKSLDNGTSWQRVYSGLNPFGISVTALALDAFAQTILAAGNVGFPFRPMPNYPVRSIDGGLSWAQAGPLSYNWPFIVADSSVPLTFYAATDGSLLRTRDSGHNWEVLPVPLPPNSRPSGLVIDPRDHNTLLLGLFGGGILRSADGGASWQPGNSGLASAGRTPTIAAVALDPDDSNVAYAAGGSFSSNPNEILQDFFRSRDGGSSWTSIGALAGTRGVWAIATSQASPGLVSVATADLGVLQTKDHGDTWTPINAGLPPSLNVTNIWASPSEPKVFYALSDVALFRLGSPCDAGPQALCLEGRFKVETAFHSPALATAAANPTPLTANTGAFWFFSSDNLELVVKVLDGRSVNGKWWVFFGALSNVEYTITVTDTQTGDVRTYFNPQGQLASVADTSAF